MRTLTLVATLALWLPLSAAAAPALEAPKPVAVVLDAYAPVSADVVRTVSAASALGAPVVAVDPSADRAAISAKLGAAGLAGAVPEENVVGAEAGLPDLAAALPSLEAHFPGHSLITFDGRKPAAFDESSVDAAAQKAEAEKDIPVESRPARELPLVLPAARPDPLALHIHVSDDFQTLTYSRVVDDAAARRLGAEAGAGALRLERLARFPSGGLLSPLRWMMHVLPAELQAAIGEVWGRHKRYTTYRGVTVSWDNDQDRHVWTTNVDTVFLLDRLEKAGVLDDATIVKAAEVGVGGGHTAAMLAKRLPGLSELTVTDISLYALRTAQRNVRPYLKPGTRLRSFLGKGVATLPGGYDLVVVNPPYIPVWPGEPGDEKDPYRGTGLIRELVERGAAMLNAGNPRAAVVVNVSSMAEKDFRSYLARFVCGWKVEKLGQPTDVPLRIVSISDQWKRWLVEQGGLRFDAAAPDDTEPYAHTLQLYRLTRR